MEWNILLTGFPPFILYFPELVLKSNTEIVIVWMSMHHTLFIISFKNN